MAAVREQHIQPGRRRGVAAGRRFVRGVGESAYTHTRTGHCAKRLTDGRASGIALISSAEIELEGARVGGAVFRTVAPLLR